MAEAKSRPTRNVSTRARTKSDAPSANGDDQPVEETTANLAEAGQNASDSAEEVLAEGHPSRRGSTASRAGRGAQRGSAGPAG
jgi:hypothetical protein